MTRSDENAIPHVIRLHGPWEGSKGGIRNSEFGTSDAQVETGEPNVSKPTRVKVPLDFGDWLEPSFRGTVVLERAFGLPTNLDQHQSIQLVVQTGRQSPSSVLLNGTSLPTSASTVSDSEDGCNEASLYRHEITSLLQARNRLRLTWVIESEPLGGLLYAAIEIMQR